jgi:hypothetical protein
MAPGDAWCWRRFTEVVVTPAAHEPSAVPCTGTAIEVEFDEVACLRIPPSTPPELAAAVMGAPRR